MMRLFLQKSNTQKVLGYVYFCAKQGGESGAYLGVCEELNDRRFVQKNSSELPAPKIVNDEIIFVRC